MQSQHVLEVTRRDRTGSRYAQRERDAGRLPAVLYGQKKDPVALSLNAKETLKFLSLGERVFTIQLKGEDASQTVLLKDLQYDYLGTNVVHVDLERVDLTQEITASVAVRIVGESPALKSATAILAQPIDSLEVRCTVADLPDHIDVDISELTLDHAILASSVKMPPGITLETDGDAVLAAITQAKAIEDAEAEDVAEDSAEPEVITEKKKEDEGEDKSD